MVYDWSVKGWREIRLSEWESSSTQVFEKTFHELNSLAGKNIKRENY